MAATIEAEAPLVVDLNPDVPEHLSLVVDRCLRKVPAERYDSTRDLARDLEQIRHHSGTRAATRLSGAAVQPVRQRRWLPAIAMLCVVILLAVVAWFWMLGSGATDSAESPLVAVRAFRNLSADGGQDHFAAGMTEEIRGQLSKMSALRLLSGAAVAAYGPGDVARMVTDLGVTSVVDGSVRRDQNRVRVSVELVDARTGQLRWSDQYEREVADVFAVQSEIALAVARTLQANLSPAERARVEKRPTGNLEAYDLYLRSQQLVPLSEQAKNDAAMKLLNQAIALDPRFAVAKARLAYRVYFEINRGDAAAPDRAMAMAREAADLDPTLAYPHFVLGSALTMKGRDAQARLEFMRALELDPNHTPTMSNLSFHEYLFGRLDESLMWARRMFLLSDRSGNAYYHVAAPLLALRDDELSWRWITEAERRANYNRVAYMVAYAQLLRGDAAGAMTKVRAAVERWPGNNELVAARAEFAYFTGAADADTLTLEVTDRTPDILGGLMGIGSRVRRAWFLKRQNDARWVQEVEEALRRRRAELAAGSESARVHLDIAAASMLQDNREDALESLTRSFKSGFREYALLEGDPILAPLRSDARFVNVIDEMKAEVTRLRRRAAERGLFDLDSLAPGVSASR
jgi:protein kinase/serine/threonine-protein kinase